MVTPSSHHYFFMKNCSHCNEIKDLTQFPRNANSKDGHGWVCKPCVVKDTQTRQRTMKGLVKKIYQNQKMTTGKMGRPSPTYTEDQLYEWMLDHDYQELWQRWTDSGHNKWLSPSVDRKDNTKSYTLDNIQLVTWRENLNNQKRDNITGNYLHTHSKAIDQLTLDGEYIQTFPSAANASRSVLGKRGCVSNITYVCTGRYKTAYGYRWRFAE